MTSPDGDRAYKEAIEFPGVHADRASPRKGCRCGDCRRIAAACRARIRANAAHRAARHPDLIPHGLPGTYANWTCHCEDCREAANSNHARTP